MNSKSEWICKTCPDRQGKKKEVLKVYYRKKNKLETVNWLTDSCYVK